MTDADVLIVGGGIAGTSAAWFAARAGRAVTIVDEGVHTASTLPVALVNPLRGHAGHLVARGVEGLRATFALIDGLRARGHPIDVGRGLFRPLVDRSGPPSTEAYWRTRLASRLAFDWHSSAPASLGLATDAPSLFLPDAGWVAPSGLLAALGVETQATRIAASAVAFRPDAVVLANGTTVRARSMLWCGGAHGAALLDGPDPHDALYKPGSLVFSHASLASQPMSFGLYAVPRDGGTIVGPTREGASPRFVVDAVAADAVRHLEDRIATTFGASTALEPMWRGVRLARLSTEARRALTGITTLSTLGSRGFLLAPLIADEWARSL